MADWKVTVTINRYLFNLFASRIYEPFNIVFQLNFLIWTGDRRATAAAAASEEVPQTGSDTFKYLHIINGISEDIVAK